MTIKLMKIVGWTAACLFAANVLPAEVAAQSQPARSLSTVKPFVLKPLPKPASAPKLQTVAPLSSLRSIILRRQQIKSIGDKKLRLSDEFAADNVGQHGRIREPVFAAAFCVLARPFRECTRLFGPFEFFKCTGDLPEMSKPPRFHRMRGGL